jgi:type II secretory ATPase GspE/PulE/Tfp pilus assembly ATPase PilB-like protein
MGIEPYLAASSVVGVLAQRLVRRNCPNCTAPFEFNPDALRAIGIQPGEEGNYRKGAGCEKCQGTGFRGRQGVYELLMVDEVVRHMTVERSSANLIRDHAVKHQGMRTLLGDGKVCVMQGKTTPDEVLRVCQREDF